MFNELLDRIKEGVDGADNEILSKITKLADAGRHITAVTVTQLSPTEFELRLTMQDWASGSDLVAGDKEILRVTDYERLSDVVSNITATVEMIEDWMIEVAKVGDAVDVARFDREGGRRWLTKPYKWRKDS